MAARRDVGGDHHLRQPAVHPVQVARAHFQPLVEPLDVDLPAVGQAGGQAVEREAGEGVHGIQVLVAGGVVGRAAAHQQLQVAGAGGAEPVAVHAVGEQQFLAAQWRHRDRGVQRLQHGGEALVGGGELQAHAVGLGDVGHRGHPAGVLAQGVDQRRHVQPGVEGAAVLALHAHLEARGLHGAGQFLAQAGGEHLPVFVGPVGEGLAVAHQLVFAPAGHLAEGGVDVGDPAVQVERTHAGEHGVLHGAAERGLGLQGGLCLLAPQRLPPVGDQHPRREGRQRRDQPEQRAAQHPLRGAPGLRAQDQAIAHRRHRQLVLVDLAGPGQAVVQRRAIGDRLAGQHLVLGVQQGHRVLGQHLRRHAVAQQAVNGVFGQQLAGELAARQQRHVQLQDGFLVLARDGLRIHRLQQVARQAIAGLGFARAQGLAVHPAAPRREAG